MVKGPPGMKRILGGAAAETGLSVTSVLSFFSRRGLICIRRSLSSRAVSRTIPARGGFLKRSVTIVDIAKRAGVSFKTVSRVLNGAPTVAVEFRRKVDAVMRELDYKPIRAARLLRGDRKSTCLNSRH